MSKPTEPRIYVACLSSYNAGILHGAWIDADQTREEIDAEIMRRVLLTSPAPNVTRCKVCFAVKSHDGEWGHFEGAENCDHDPAPSSEEFAIHDHEGFEGLKIGEYEPIERVAMLANLLSDHDGPVIEAALDHLTDPDASEIEDWISENYQGTYRTLEDYAQELADSTGMLANVPEEIARYFDWEAYARDLELGGDVFTVEGGRGIHVFWNH